MLHILFVQPVLAPYRFSVVTCLSERYSVTVATDSRRQREEGFPRTVPQNARYVETPIIDWRGRLFYQTGVLRQIILERPHAVLFFANTRFLSFWFALVLCKLLDIPFYSHGQGLYRYPVPSNVRRLTYRLACRLSTKYICYSEISRASLLQAGCSKDKLVLAENSISLTKTVTPHEKSYGENGILYIGRLRERCGLAKLIDAVRALRQERPAVVLHVVGGGALEARMRKGHFDDRWIVWHGAVFADGQVAKISQGCRLGCYPGDAGLSVVHMFGLSLPPLVHADLSRHMGPEPSYVEDGVNGFTFSREDSPDSLLQCLRRVWALNTEELRAVGERAFREYELLNAPPLGERFARIMSLEENAEA